MELEYIIPMGKSVVYYEGSDRLKWASRCNDFYSLFPYAIPLRG